jgi:hypothetical protein
MEELRQKGACIPDKPTRPGSRLPEKFPPSIENGEAQNYPAAVADEPKVNHQPQIQIVQDKEQQT